MYQPKPAVYVTNSTEVSKSFLIPILMFISAVGKGCLPVLSRMEWNVLL